MLRATALGLLAVGLGAPAHAPADATPASAYARANARLAHATPHYPLSRVLVREGITGAVGSRRFEAIQRISLTAKPVSQAMVLDYYRERLGVEWRSRGRTCLVSGSRAVVVVVGSNRRRLGVLIDSRGAWRCAGLTALLGDLLELGYPEG